MSLKSSEINNCSWIISGVLESPFYSSSCCQTCFPSIVRPMNRSWECILKIFLILQKWIAPSSSRCICCEWRRRNVTFFDTSYSEKKYFTGSTSIQFLLSMGNDSRWRASRFSSLWFCFCLRSACKIFCTQFLRIFFELIFGNFCFNVVQFHHKLIWSIRNSDPGVSVVCSKTKFWSQLRI